MFLDECGISPRIFCPRTSEKIGLVDYNHKHINNIGLTLLLESTMSNKYWMDAFYTAAFLINRLPTFVLKNKSPYDMLYL